MNKTSDKIAEFGSFHAHFWVVFLLWLDDAALHGDSNGSNFVVSRDHSDSDTSIVAVDHSFGHFLSNDVLDSDDGDQCVTSEFNIIDLIFILLVLVGRTTVSVLDVLVG